MPSDSNKDLHLERVDHGAFDLLTDDAAEDVERDDGAESEDEEKEQKRAEKDRHPTNALDGAEAAQQAGANGDDGDGETRQRQHGEKASLNERAERFLIGQRPNTEGQQRETRQNEEGVKEDEEEANQRGGSSCVKRHRGVKSAAQGKPVFEVEKNRVT